MDPSGHPGGFPFGHPAALAHTATPTDSKVGDITLGPAGTPGARLHQFGFNMNSRGFLHIEYAVTTPQGQAVSFSLHCHNATRTVEILNLTQASELQESRVLEAGFYMPQWINSASIALTLH